MKRLLALLVALTGVVSAGETNEMPSIEKVKARHAERLLDLPSVASIGIGRTPEGEPAIIVGLDKEEPATRQALPTELEGYPVWIRVIGPPRAQ